MTRNLCRCIVAAFPALIILGFTAYMMPALAQCGKASFYCCEFHGRMTACGQRFNQNAMTAASNSLPCGTKALVRNVQNGRSVQVTITDTGGFGKYGRILDLSRGAFARLANPAAGVINICVEKL